jgi:conjugative transfer region protein TrbK
MSDPLSPQQFTRIAVVAFLAFTAVVVVINRRNGVGAAAIATMEHEQVDSIGSELARCRTITSDQTIALESCRRAWASNRKHFFASAKSMSAQIPSAGDTVAPAKSQDRVTPVEVQSEAR